MAYPLRKEPVQEKTFQPVKKKMTFGYRIKSVHDRLTEEEVHLYECMALTSWESR